MSSKAFIGGAIIIAVLFATPASCWMHGIVRPAVGVMDSFLDSLQGGEEYNDPDRHPLFLKCPNWFPLSEAQVRNDQAVELELVEGRLPSDLDGVALRVGPNADPDTGFNKRMNAIIDGDGLLHSVRLDGKGRKKALYSAGWLDTPRRQFESNMGRAFFLRVGEMTGIVGMLKLLIMPLKLYLFGQSQERIGQANTSIFTFDNRLYALQENSLPFEFDLKEDGTFQSIGYQDFGGVLNYPFGAHPRLDPGSGELFFCGYSPFGGSALKWGAISPSSPDSGATVTRYIGVESPGGGKPFAHDFAITKNYILILDNSVRFDFSDILNGNVIKLDEQKKSTVGICPKNATSSDDILWYTHHEALALIHFVNAWEEDDGRLILWAPIWGKFVGDVVSITDDPADIIRMTEFTFDLNDPDRRIRTRDVENNTPSPTATDFPVVNANFVGRKSKCAFAGIMKRNVIDFDGISKWHLAAGPSGGLAEKILHGDGITGGEPIIAPKFGKGDKDSCAVYVINYVHDSNTSESYLVIYDGENFTDKPVAKYRLPHRVPSGLHAKWVDADMLTPVLGNKS